MNEPPNKTLQPTIGARRLRFAAGWLTRRSRLSVKPLGVTTFGQRMELAALVLSVLSLVGLGAAGLLLRGYLPSYVAEKGKNAASKEDLAHLTEVVEGTKALHTAEIERPYSRRRAKS